MSDLVGRYRVEQWVPAEVISSSRYADYWNDVEAESAKAWNVADGSFSRMEEYLESEGLLEDIRRCLRAVQLQFNRGLHGVGADLASGSLWAAPLLTSQPGVDLVYCVEFSRHRLLQLGPMVLDHYNVPPEKVVLCLGSFYQLAIPDAALDFVLLSQAFHHADDAPDLLDEIRRVLKPGGVVLVTGEPVFGMTNQARYLLKQTVGRVLPRPVQARVLGRTIAPAPIVPRGPILADPVLGDHWYTRREYLRLFARHGFESYSVPSASPRNQAFLLRAG